MIVMFFNLFNFFEKRKKTLTSVSLGGQGTHRRTDRLTDRQTDNKKKSFPPNPLSKNVRSGLNPTP